MNAILSTRLAPFRHRDFRKFFAAQSLSMIGSWSHDLARSWIIVEATGSSGALGNLNMAIAVPCLLLILQGGVLVDRTDVRKLIQRTKSFLGISSLVLAALAEFSHIQVWQLLIFGLIEGIIISFDSPAFQALTVRMVPREDFQQAIALNSTNFHASRTLGPIVAAWLMAWHGPSLVFLFDGLTYFLVALVLINVHLLNIQMGNSDSSEHDTATKSTLKSGNAQASRKLRPKGLREGLYYTFSNHVLRYRVMQLMLSIGCVFPLTAAVFRVYVTKKFHLDAGQFGAVFSFPALGSMAGALSFAVLKPKEPLRAIYFGIPLVFVLLIVLPWLESLNLTVLAMSLIGFGIYLTFASLTVSMQLEVQEEFRGRLSSIIGMGFSSIGPLLCFPWGHLADFIGPPATILLSAGCFGLGSVGLALANRQST